ncbi:MAG: hypothetical protein HC877_11645 [Thioploca sp.]|nr:hypothetical protein [Thioploca sp.]
MTSSTTYKIPNSPSPSIENLRELTQAIETAHPDWCQSDIVSQLRRSIPEYSRGIWSAAMPFNRGPSLLEENFQHKFREIVQQMIKQEGIDLGHVVASIDIAQSFDIIDDTHASWAGDLGSAVLTSFRERDHLQIGPVGSRASMPDLLGDIDGDNIAHHMLEGQELEALFNYYQGIGEVNMSNRYTTFAQDLGLLDQVGRFQSNAINIIESHTKSFIYSSNFIDNVRHFRKLVDGVLSGEVQPIFNTDIPNLIQNAAEQFREIIETGLHGER